MKGLTLRSLASLIALTLLIACDVTGTNEAKSSRTKTIFAGEPGEQSDDIVEKTKVSSLEKDSKTLPPPDPKLQSPEPPTEPPRVVADDDDDDDDIPLPAPAPVGTPAEPSPVPTPNTVPSPPPEPAPAPAPTPERTPANPLDAENQRPGSTTWRLNHPSTHHEVEGYASTISVQQGRSFDLNISTSVARPVTWEAFRIGNYNGAGARLVTKSSAAANATKQADCPIRALDGLIDCSWNATFTIATTSDWYSGIYLIKVTRLDASGQADADVYVPIIVREATPRAPVIVQASVTTWQAYNHWGGMSLYFGEKKGDIYAKRVSFNRPFDEGNGAGRLFLREVHMVRWLESRGYDVAYTTNLDLAAGQETLSGRKFFLSMGHDEYWSPRARDVVERARDQYKVSAGFFTANAMYWQVRFETNGKTLADRHDPLETYRIMACYKPSSTIIPPWQDAMDNPNVNVRDLTHLNRENAWSYNTSRHEGVEQANTRDPENALLGVMLKEVPSSLSGWHIVVDSPQDSDRSWLYQGTNVQDGQKLAPVIGHEWDQAFDDHTFKKSYLERRGPSGLVRVSRSPATGYSEMLPADMVFYRSASNDSFVFAGGTVNWSLALMRNGFDNSSQAVQTYADPVLQRMTDNILMAAGAVPAEPPPTVAAETVPPNPNSSVRDFISGGNETAKLRGPVGLAVTGSGNSRYLYVAESRAHRIRRYKLTGSGNSLTASGGTIITGCTLSGYYERDQGDNTCLSVPTDLVEGPGGSVFIADSGNHCIRKMTAAGDTTPFAGTCGSSGNSPTDATTATRIAKRLSAKFTWPTGLLRTADEALLVTDARNGKLRRIDLNADEVTTLATDLLVPTGLTSSGSSIFLLESAYGRIIRYEPVTAGSTRALRNGVTIFEQTPPQTLAMDGMFVGGTRVFFTDSGNFQVKSVAMDGPSTQQPLIVAGNGWYGSQTGRLGFPRGVAYLGEGYFLIADTVNDRVLLARAP